MNIVWNLFDKDAETAVTCRDRPIGIRQDPSHSSPFALPIPCPPLLFSDGNENFVIMPNHVHLLVQMRSGWELRKQSEGWLRFTGRRINRIRGDVGEFWQSEPFDHIVRSEEQFLYLQQYIIDNPRKANLKPGEFLIWTREHGFCRQLHDSPSREPYDQDSESREPESSDSESRATEEH